MNLIERLNTVFALDPSAPAIEFNGIWFSWSALKHVMTEVDRLMTAAGLGEGGAVGVLLRNQPGLFVAALGTITSGRTMMPFNPMQPEARVRADIEELRAPVLIASAADWKNAWLHDAARATGALGITIETSGDALTVRVVPGLEKIGTGAHQEPMPGIAINMLTSGTTGKPKRVQLATSELSKTLWAGSQYESKDPANVQLQTSAGLLWTPLVHIGGMWTGTYLLYNGRKFALMERFEPKAWHELVVRHRIRFLALPPSALRMVLDQNFPREDFAHVLGVRAGTAPLNPDLADAFEERYGIPVLDAYGATEFAGGVAGWTLGDHKKHWKQKRGSVGRANVGVQLRVVDRDTFELLPPDQPGLLEINPANGAEGRWVRTTDLARIDADGFLFILGRADNMIIRGGFKVAPDDVVKALQQHPAIREASVVALPDERLGQVPVAAYELNDGAADPGAEALNQFLRESLKAYEVPVAFKAVDKLPRTPSMKVSQPDVKLLFSAS